MSRAIWLCVVTLGCASTIAGERRGEPGIDCAAQDACSRHERECHYQGSFACENCAGLIHVCVARSAKELEYLDKERRYCETVLQDAFSYSLGCRCGQSPCESEEQCVRRGGFAVGAWCSGLDLTSPK